jgi:hypothetical protein
MPADSGPKVRVREPRPTMGMTMHIRLQMLVAALALAVPLCAFADCNYPKAPQHMPDGKTATEAEMVQAMTAFKQYNGDVDAFTSCLDKETSDKVREAGSATAAFGNILQIKTLQSKKHNAAVAELQEKMKRFNEQVRAFKSRGG